MGLLLQLSKSLNFIDVFTTKTKIKAAFSRKGYICQSTLYNFHIEPKPILKYLVPHDVFA